MQQTNAADGNRQLNASERSMLYIVIGRANRKPSAASFCINVVNDIYGREEMLRFDLATSAWGAHKG